MLRKMEWWADWRIALAVTAALRVLYSALAAVLSFILHPNAALISSNAFTENLPAPGGWYYALLGIWERFDTLWYLQIAERGYRGPGAIVFYPLYPWLIRLLGSICEPVMGALVISTAGAFFYFLGLLILARGETAAGQRPLRTVALAAVWPASYFFFAGYAEALTAALIVWCIAWARDERWLRATACAVAAGLARSVGTLLVVPLLIMAWRARGTSRWWVVLSPAGTLGYWLWLKQTGLPSMTAAYRSYWNIQVTAPWTTLWAAIRYLVSQFDSLVAINLVALALFFAAGVLARRRPEDRCFSAAAIAHLLLRQYQQPLLGTPRYLLPVYPAFLTMGEWAEKMKASRFALLCLALFLYNLLWLRAFLNWSLVL